MSSLTILGDTSGSVVLQAPAVAGSSTITLPTTGGTIRTTTTPGTILQVVQTVMSSAQSHNTLTPAAVGLDVSITPSSSSNKVLVSVNTFIGGAQTANEYLSVYRGATILGGKNFSVVRIEQAGQSEYICVPVSWSYLDSPATTSSTTYSFKIATNYLTVYVNRPYNTGGFSDVLISTITAMEVAA